MGARGGIAAAFCDTYGEVVCGRLQSTFCLPGWYSATSDPSRMRDARFATSSLAPAGIWFARRLLRGGGFGYNKELARLIDLAAPYHPIPRRVLPPARLVQKRKRVVFFVPRIAVGERGTAVAPTFHQSLVLRD